MKRTEEYFMPEPTHEIYRTRRLTESFWPATDEKVLLESSVGQELRKAAAEVPDRLGLVEGIPEYDKRRRWTYAELLADSEKVARALLTKYKPGDKIAIWGDNIPEWVLVHYGINLAGMILVTLNPAFQYEEAEYQVGQSDSVALFCLKSYRGNDVWGMAQKMKEALPGLQDVWDLEDLESFIQLGNESVTFPEVKPDDVCFICYTSGTTGRPKGAMLYNRSVVSGIKFMTERGGIEMGDIWLNPMPNYHYGGVGYGLTGNLMIRGTNVLVRTFEPKSALEISTSEKATFFFGAPSMLTMMINNFDPKVHKLRFRHFMSGSAKVEEWLAKHIFSMGAGICISFGQTEAHGGVSETHMDDTMEDLCNTLGQPFPLIDIKIADPDTGAILPIGEVGEVWTKGYCNMLGYYKNPEATAEAMPGGWLRHGDLCRMDDRGFLYFEGRLKDMIVRGGENIYPAEVESLIKRHPKVQDVAMVGVPSKEWGEEVGALIIPKSWDDLPDIQELDEFCKANLTAFKRPRLWAFVKDFPYTLNLKLKKFELKKMIDKGEIELKRT